MDLIKPQDGMIHRALQTEDLLHVVLLHVEDWNASDFYQCALVQRAWRTPFLRQLWRTHGTIVDLSKLVGFQWCNEDGRFYPFDESVQWDLGLWQKYAGWVISLGDEAALDSGHEVFEIFDLLDKYAGGADKNHILPNLRELRIKWSVASDPFDGIRAATKFLPSSLVRLATEYFWAAEAAQLVQHVTALFPAIEEVDMGSVFLRGVTKPDEETIDSVARATRSLPNLRSWSSPFFMVAGVPLINLSQIPSLQSLHLTSVGDRRLHEPLALENMVAHFGQQVLGDQSFPSLVSLDTEIYLHDDTPKLLLTFFGAHLRSLRLSVWTCLGRECAPRSGESLASSLAKFTKLHTLRLSFNFPDASLNYPPSRGTPLDDSFLKPLSDLSNLEALEISHPLVFDFTPNTLIETSRNWKRMVFLTLIDAQYARNHSKISSKFDIDVLVPLLRNMPMITQLTMTFNSPVPVAEPSLEGYDKADSKLKYLNFRESFRQSSPENASRLADFLAEVISVRTDILSDQYAPFWIQFWKYLGGDDSGVKESDESDED